MITFPNTKINIGLNIIDKRKDSYHNIETVFYPIQYNDILEIVENHRFEFINHGITIDCKANENLCVKAYELLKSRYNIPNIKIILYKNVPFGTGLGAGSSNAAFTIRMINDFFKLQISDEKLIEIASKLGADCAFFIKNTPQFAYDIGNKFKIINLSLKDYYLALCIPNVSVSTKKAYQNCISNLNYKSLEELIKLPVNTWKDNIKNDFETTIFKEHAVLESIKSELYEKGATYAQMSGSGSAIFGLFKDKPSFEKLKSCNNIKVIRINS